MKSEKVLKIFGVEKVDDGMDLVKIHAMLNFMFALKNVSFYKFRDELWGGNVLICNDMDMLFMNKNYDLLEFMFALDEEDRGKVMRWILENYEGVKMENVKKYYLTDKMKRDEKGCL